MLIGIDTGGTFTDLVAFVGGELRTHKVLSTPHDPAAAVLSGLAELLPGLLNQRPTPDAERRPSRAKRGPRPQLTYSSTVATNALLERKGARVVLLTTRGFEDIIEIGRQNRSELYALEPTRPEPLVPRQLRVGVDERMLVDGSALRPLRPAAVRAALAAVRRQRPDAVAVCFLHSYVNPRHEQQIGAALAQLADVFVALSHDLVPEYREYERLSTTVINAYVGPLMSRHLAQLERGVGDGVRFRVLQSNGGAISAALASHEAVRTCLSGPAGGVMGAQRVAVELGLDRIITFDMGGTSTDVSILNGGPQYTTEWQIDGLPLKVPAIDIHTVGAGGGSLAAVDAGGLLKVGPASAGADPGPACYGRGSLATVTDANVVLGRLIAAAFLAGRMPLQRERAARAVAAVARQLGIGRDAAAEGIVRVVNASMERAVRRVSVERGHDPRDYALVAFGGAAGQHACELADALGMRLVVVPRHPGLLSAWGAACADVQRDTVRSVRLSSPGFATLQRLARPLLRQAQLDLRAEGVARAATAVRVSIDVRYAGQSYEINVPLAADFRATFDTRHERLYGYADSQRDIEVVNLRLTALGRTPELKTRAPVRPLRSRSQPHRVFVGGRWHSAQVWQRQQMPANRAVQGPAVIVEFSATTFIPPGWRGKLHRSGHLLIERK